MDIDGNLALANHIVYAKPHDFEPDNIPKTLLDVKFKVAKEKHDIWYIYDLDGNRIPQCGRWDSLEKAVEEGQRYFEKLTIVEPNKPLR